MNKIIATDREKVIQLCERANEEWLTEAASLIKRMPDEIWDHRLAAIDDLFTFAKLVNPGYMYGDVHREIYQWMQDYNLYGVTKSKSSNKLIMLPRAHLKALEVNQRVLTPLGWTKIGDLSRGDFITGRDGQPKLVTQVHPVSKMDLYEVQTRTGRKVLCNDEHLWTVICPSNTGDKEVTKPLKEIISNYKSNRLDKRRNKEYTEYRYFLPNIAPADLPEKNLPIDPYVLGAWLGDGTSSQGAMTSADPFIMDEIGYHYEITKHNKLYGYGVLGLLKDLRDLGVLNNKHVPEIYLQGSIGQRLSLLHGLMDTDGTIQSNGTVASFSNTNKRLIDAVVDLVRSLGGVATVGETYSTDGVTDTPHHSWYVTIKMQGLCPVRLPRKVSKWSDSRSLREAIISIKKVDSGLARCISVEDEMFITEDYMLTHNSHMVATWASWMIVRHPELTMLYLSATAELSEIQLYDVKNRLSTKRFRMIFPEYVNPQEGRRAKWSSTKIIIDHPQRAIEGIRDATIATAGLTTNTTGWHADIVVPDDLVVPENAYTEDGRDLVAKKSSQFTSIRNAGGFTMACGTRYHPSDIYDVWKNQQYDEYDDDGMLLDTHSIWSIKEFVVEEHGIFTWPRAVRPSDGKPFGFNLNELSRIKSEYIDQVQFYAQYYNDPNAPGSDRISRDKFQYGLVRRLNKKTNGWHYGTRRLNVYAAIDFAFSLNKKADWTAIVVIGIDHEDNTYVLDIDRFKTDSIAEYFKHIKRLHSKWNFRKLRAEVTVAQLVIVREIKNYLKKEGLRLPIDEYRPNRKEGSKEERIAAAVEHRYDNMSVYHFEGGWTNVLEDELVKSRPAHDDIKDALASAVCIAVAPKKSQSTNNTNELFGLNKAVGSRFGGI